MSLTTCDFIWHQNRGKGVLERFRWPSMVSEKPTSVNSPDKNCDNFSRTLLRLETCNKHIVAGTVADVVGWSGKNMFVQTQWTNCRAKLYETMFAFQHWNNGAIYVVWVLDYEFTNYSSQTHWSATHPWLSPLWQYMLLLLSAQSVTSDILVGEVEVKSPCERWSTTIALIITTILLII